MQSIELFGHAELPVERKPVTTEPLADPFSGTEFAGVVVDGAVGQSVWVSR
jgi:hypothetical protein